MAKYTVLLYDYLRAGEDIEPLDLIGTAPEKVFSENVLSKASEMLGGNKTNFFEELFYSYMFREIGFETIPLWRFKMSAKLNEVLPYYHDYLRSVNLEFNILDDVNYTKNTNEETSDNGFSKTENRGDITRKDTGTTEYEKSEDNKQTRSGSTERERTDTYDTTDTETNTGKVERSETVTPDTTTATVTDTRDVYSDTPAETVGDALGADGVNGGATNMRRTVNDTETTNTGTTKTDTTETPNTTRELVKGGSVTTNESETDRDRMVVEEKDLSDKRTDDLQHVETHDTDSTVTTTADGSRDVSETVKGKMFGGSYSSMIQEYRKTVVNIAKQFAEEFESLFMGVW